ncbi:glycerophosphodiester phosphodiesterase [Ectobacillus sp. JY-23]|uniref:glycerophosphodiester phosphodiesterase n=1 Tax=Ectobacillus sp. JY-23 TaxID=2933872 RepID=UPI001FF2E603|nr:glycerophosphodiester phosphodiesterase [Ectobacillus sp. JY-23]UOY91269.1 glycerophosphodiester phosphodiesterase [Ectobacillus sp. JY-23]
MNLPLIFAHRGVKGTHPENTMIAFREAERVGAHGIELDVHLSKDGEVVIIHDETLDRTTNGSGLVCEKTLDELQQLDAGSYFGFGGEHVPSLKEVLTWMQGNTLLLNIELKNDMIRYTNLEQKVIHLVREYNMEKRVILSSFNHESVAVLGDLAPDIERAILYHHPLQNPLQEARNYQAHGLHPNFRLLTPEFVLEARQQGYPLRPYTINQPQDLQSMIDLGVDVIITDWPERAFSLLNKRKS